MMRIVLYKYVYLLVIFEMCIIPEPVTSHKIPTFFSKLYNSNTHLDDSYRYNENTPLEPERHYNDTGSSFYYSSAPSSTVASNGQNNTNKNEITADHSDQNNVNLAGNNNNTNVGQPNKQDLANEAVKLDDEVKSMKESKDEMDELEKKEKEVSEQLTDTNYEKLNELIKKRNLLVNEISSVAKTLRREHDILYPELRNQPIYIVAKNKDDEKRKANQLAHLEGFEDFMHHITSPCNMMEQLRENSNKSKKSSLKDKFETEQKILDSMNSKERLNYDKNMIEHYESIMQEIEQGIQKAEDEIDKTWNHLVE